MASSEVFSAVFCVFFLLKNLNLAFELDCILAILNSKYDLKRVINFFFFFRELRIDPELYLGLHFGSKKD